MSVQEDMLQEHFNDADLSTSSAQVPIFLCLDASGSMEGAKIRSLNDGVRAFIESGKENEDALDSLFLFIASFNGHGVRIMQGLRNIQNVNFQPLEAFGGTPFGEAVNLTLDEIEKNTKINAKIGRDSNKPYLIVMSDGKPDDPAETERAITRVQRMLQEKRLRVRCVRIGEDEDYSALKRLAEKGEVIQCGELEIRNFFDWVSKMAIERSQRSLAEKDEEGNPNLLLV